MIAGQSQTIAPTAVTTPNITLTFTGDVHALQFTYTSGSGILPFDNLTFGTLTSAPEPGTLLLFPAAFAGVALLRRRSAD